MKTWKKLAIGLAVMTLLTPLGILAKGTAWGEWNLHATYGQGAVGYLISAVMGVALIVIIAWGIGRLLTKDKQNAS